jgi:hypothetical protein
MGYTPATQPPGRFGVLTPRLAEDGTCPGCSQGCTPLYQLPTGTVRCPWCLDRGGFTYGYTCKVWLPRLYPTQDPRGYPTCRIDMQRVTALLRGEDTWWSDEDRALQAQRTRDRKERLRHKHVTRQRQERELLATRG